MFAHKNLNSVYNPYTQHNHCKEPTKRQLSQTHQIVFWVNLFHHTYQDHRQKTVNFFLHKLLSLIDVTTGGISCICKTFSIRCILLIKFFKCIWYIITSPLISTSLALYFPIALGTDFIIFILWLYLHQPYHHL